MTMANDNVNIMAAKTKSQNNVNEKASMKCQWHENINGEENENVKEENNVAAS
jgi:hypothetical protein